MANSSQAYSRNVSNSGPPPHAGGSAGSSRLGEAFDNIRREFDIFGQEVTTLRVERDELEARLAQQITELSVMRESFYDLERAYQAVKQQYDGELDRLRHELNLARSAIEQQQRQMRPTSPSAPGPYPGESHRQQQPYYPRERERERDSKRDRERDPRGGLLPEPRDAKRFKAERELGQRRLSDVSPRLNTTGPTPKLPPLPNPSSHHHQAHPGPIIPPPVLSPIGPQQQPYGSEQSLQRPTLTLPPPPHLGPADGLLPDEADLAKLPPELKKEGPDWFVLFNRQIQRTLDINLLHTFQHETVVCCVQFSNDGRFLATGCNRTAQIYDVNTGQKTCVLEDVPATQSGDLYIRSVRFSPDGKYLATGAEDKLIRMWDIAQRKVIQTFKGHSMEIYSLVFSPDGRLVISGSGDGTARVWDIAGVLPPRVLQTPESSGSVSSVPDPGVTSVAISPDGRFVAAGSLDTLIRIWDIHDGILLDQLDGHNDSVYSVAFTPNGRGVVSGSLDKTIKYWDLGQLKVRSGSGPLSSCRMDFAGHKDYVLSVAVSHDGRWVVSGSKDRGVQFWDSENAMVQCMLQGHKNSVISIDLNPTGNVLATGSGDTLARIWSYKTTV